MSEFSVANPFVVGRYVSEHYFCDRENETSFLTKQLVNGRDVALISPRRMGKTGLIQHCLNQTDFKENFHTFFVDIYATTSLEEFVFLLGKEIYEELKPKKTVWKENFYQIISSLRMGFKLNAISGEPVFDIGIGEITSPQTTLEEIFTYLENADKPCIVAIDEFQQIGTYKENNIEALLRTHVQRCKNTNFIFSGSKRHLMNNMFNSSSKPFYQSAINMGLEPIPLESYMAFASALFEERSKHIDISVIEDVYKRFDGCTWFVQMLMNELFLMTLQNGNCGNELIDEALDNVIISQEGVYKAMLATLAPKQKMVLQAIAREREAEAITSYDFIRKYNLHSASSVQAAVKPLLKNEIVILEGDSYRVHDYFFAEWIRREY